MPVAASAGSSGNSLDEREDKPDERAREHPGDERPRRDEAGLEVERAHDRQDAEDDREGRLADAAVTEPDGRRGVEEPSREPGEREGREEEAAQPRREEDADRAPGAPEDDGLGRTARGVMSPVAGSRGSRPRTG